MELPEVDELPKKFLREEAGRAFRLQAAASMDMWLCVKRAITAAERAKKAYEDGRSKVAEAGKALQEHALLAKQKDSAERQVKEMKGLLEAALEATKDAEASKDAVQVALEESERAKAAAQAALEESERAKAAEIEAAVQSAIQGYRPSSEFSILLDKEVGSEMADLLYRFKRYNPGQKLNLNFIADPPPLPEGITEEMIEDYEGEDAAEGSGPAEAAAGDEA
ncbi:KNR4/SMI1 homolog [Prunus persica]|uniref:KNR4/SMI1 homolog n=1 Tax=Prunus persica TaxID=3760 RepID=UPI0009AB7DA3|nr:KNR4/SMI1 homolog [Prunus persica]